jgi:nucleoid-associated protein YgaU
MNRLKRFGILPLALLLAGSLRADDKAAAPAPDDLATLRSDNKQLTDELASSWKESDKLKASLADAQAAAAKSASDAADLQKQLDAAKAQAPKPDAAPAAGPDAQQLADVQDKLATSLRSFSVIQDENTELKATIDKLNADAAALGQQLDAAHATIASLQAQAAIATQVDPLRTQLRQAQDEANRLSMENGDLRTRLSLQAPSPGSTRPIPMRPERAVAAAPVAEPTPTPTPELKMYLVAEGDTLTKISRRFYGTSGRWEDILKANSDVLKDEKSLVVGSTLKIP